MRLATFRPLPIPVWCRYWWMNVCRDDGMTGASRLAADVVAVTWLSRDPAQRRQPLLQVLGRHLGARADAVQLVEDEHGKPRLADPHGGLQFNWSHCGDTAVVAAARGEIELGIDVERCTRRVNIAAVAQRYFAPSEVALLNHRVAAERRARFFAMWTAKEAVLKVLGRGLAFGIDQVVIGFDGRQPILQAIAGQAADLRDWHLHPLVAPVPGLVAALAWHGAPRVVTLVDDNAS